MKKHNFSAGPSILAPEVFQKASQALLDFEGTGLSVIEISHRSPEFVRVIEHARALALEIAGLDNSYETLFLQGGASMQFLMVPYNLLETKAAYIDTGTWANKAQKEAALFGNTEVIASSKADGYKYIPKNVTVPTDANYLHITTNNTIYGTEYRKDFDVKVPLIADMSSDIMSRPVDVSKYNAIYAGAQKNIAMAGVTVIILKDEALGKAPRELPTMIDYRTHVEKGSMFNTPPVVPVYSMLENLRWLKKHGGVEAADKRAHERAEALYAEIDRNKLFKGTVEEASRSVMNICFVMNEGYEALEKPFLDFATERGMVGIKGHRSVGGFRASCYNAQTMEGVNALIQTMRDFEAQH